MRFVYHFAILGILSVVSCMAQSTFIDYYDGNLEILSAKKAKYEVVKRWTVYSKEEKEHAYIFLPYGSFSEVRYVDLKIYDKNGQLLTKLKKDDFFDQNFSRGFEITNDRLLFYQFESSNYPFTLELSYQYDYNGLLFLPDFTPMEEYNCELNKASFKAICPKEYLLRYKSNKVSKVHIDTTDKDLIYQWTFAPQKSNGKQEAYSPFDESAVPFVLLAPSDFEVNKTRGSQRSWKAFGEWIISLNQDKQQLPEETVSVLKNNFDSINDFRKKVESVYRWMQNRTRYVSVQEGLGGWQPYSAMEVDQNGYGDCKALVNYTQSALNTVGIESFYTLIKSSPSKQIDTSFCRQAFNHVILSVPSPQGDTIWLECTSQHTPANFLSSSCSNKYALLVKEGASQIVKTPDFPKSKAVSTSHSSINLLVDGQAQIDFSSDYSFYFYEGMLALMFENKNQQKKELEEFLSVSSADIEDISVKTSERPSPQIHLSSQIITHGFYTKFGKSVAFSPCYMKSNLPHFSYNTKRFSDIEIKYDFIQCDTVKIEIPNGFEINFLPESLSHETNRGSYSITYSTTTKAIYCILNQKLFKGIYPNTQYEALLKFQQDIQTAFNRKIVIKVSET